jgi:hypothetical protein
MPDNLALLVYESWSDLDRATAGLTPEQATERRDGQSAIAWTVGHVSQPPRGRQTLANATATAAPPSRALVAEYASLSTVPGAAAL